MRGRMMCSTPDRLPMPELRLGGDPGTSPERWVWGCSDGIFSADRAPSKPPRPHGPCRTAKARELGHRSSRHVILSGR